MGNRTRKPSVKAEMRREWLRRNEEDGESPPQIAAKDGYDVRTVRKQIGLAKEERETREARACVLRNALESHYDDLRRYAEMLDSQVSGVGYTKSIPDANFIEAALRQHLPRSPVWNYLSRLESLKQRRSEQVKRIENLVKEATKAGLGLTALVQAGLKDVTLAVVTAIIYQAGEWSKGSPESNLVGNLISEPAEGGRVSLRLASVPMGQVKAEDAERCKEVLGEFLRGLQSRLRDSEEYRDLEKTTTEVERTRRNSGRNLQ